MNKKQYITFTIEFVCLTESDCITASGGDNLVDDNEVFVP